MSFDPRRLSRRDLRRLVKDMWSDPRCDSIAGSTLVSAVKQNAQSLDRAVVAGYLRHFPTSHPEFEALNSAARFTAERRDWAWRERGEKWDLWRPAEGVSRLASAMLENSIGASALDEAGLQGELSQGQFAKQAVAKLCLSVGRSDRENAFINVTSLLDLKEELPPMGLSPLVCWALVNPLSKGSIPNDFRNKILDRVCKTLGDPRIHKSRWAQWKSELHGYLSGEEIHSFESSVNRWLVRATVDQFFEIVLKSTDNPHQWRQRTEFWSGYLAANLIDDAWFILGPRAEDVFRGYRDIELPHGRIRAGDGGSGHSAILMRMKNLLICEWSDNGACRFWFDNLREAPQLGKKIYYKSDIKRRSGGAGFEKLGHLPSPGWEPKFADKIYQLSGISHPELGAGRRKTS